MKVWDVFLFNGEEKMLNFRLHELNDVVDYFVVCEGSYTFQGKEKELIYPKIAHKFEAFKDKIIYSPCTVLHSTSSPWHNEWGQRSHAKFTLLENSRLQGEDLILISDVDEIPDAYALKQILSWGSYSLGPRVFNMYMYYYNVECKLHGTWKGTVSIKWAEFKQLDADAQHLRNIREKLPTIANNDGVSGWHYSYFGDTKYIINKLKSFSHNEYNTEYYTDPNRIEEAIKNNKDLFGRKEANFYKVQNESFVPKYIALLKD